MKKNIDLVVCTGFRIHAVKRKHGGKRMNIKEVEKVTKHKNVSREGLRIWYNGYHTFRGESVYNPRSVVFALTNNNLASYWTSSGPYDEIYYYIEKNVAGKKDVFD